ncbi:phosphate acyltransferase PlsX [Serpentinicella alkaliphila]|uniref:Phosphate acyltransferase n=1 Tax=Serpentinicella alkaliphila TaxID=1734049 RepID=A0A4V2T4M4_9FIRM|nr:phosphate acyltransferase PlsX [Serpentinicella alkaliphila]QUH26249.1 phosphate acyltransferase PlsX [Serpentinicella alkaliphila]TCQ05824.1 phosphate:acyl-[acyl carrier protein] acyltransferase [Serpentinicella alkaliphila]
MKIVLDGMGGDHGPQVTVLGAVNAVKEYDVNVIITGDKERIEKELSKYDYPKDKIEIIHCDEEITNEDKPVQAIRRKKNSSMVVGINLVKEKKADAVISAGNTGALLAGGLLLLGRIEGIDRPALAPVYPTLKGISVLIDGGANADSKPRNFLEFGIMGSIYATKVLKINKPKVCIANIGIEETKGNDVSKEAYQLFKTAPFNFTGNVEARDIPAGHADVIVCDGFTGNVILKLTEGVAGAILSSLKVEFTRTFFTKIGALILKPGLVNFKKTFDYTEYGGAPFLGVNGALIKAHGSSDAKAIKNAIRQAKLFVENGVLEDILREIKVLGEDNVD